MDTILQVIDREFFLAEYEKLKEGFPLYSHRDYGDFWIVIECNDYEFPIQDEIYEKFSEILKHYKEAEKNTSLLFLNKVDSWQGENNDKIMSLENDPYFYKKYVITYTPAMEKQALDILGEKNIGEIVSNNELFKQLKSRENEENGLSLLYTIIHKLVFVGIPAEREQFVHTDIDWSEYESVREEIGKFIEVEDKELLKNKFKNLIETAHYD